MGGRGTAPLGCHGTRPVWSKLGSGAVPGRTGVTTPADGKETAVSNICADTSCDARQFAKVRNNCYKWTSQLPYKSCSFACSLQDGCMPQADAPSEEAVLSCCRRLDMWLRSCAACLDAASARLRSRSACLHIGLKCIIQLPVHICTVTTGQHASSALHSEDARMVWAIEPVRLCAQSAACQWA